MAAISFGHDHKSGFHVYDASRQRHTTNFISYIIFHGYDLSRGGNAFAKDCIDNQPRDDQANEVPVLDPNKVLCKRHQ